MPILLQKNKTYLPILSSYYFSSQSFQGVSYFHEARHISRFIFFRWGHPDVQMGLENETTCRWWFKGGALFIWRQLTASAIMPAGWRILFPRSFLCLQYLTGQTVWAELEQYYGKKFISFHVLAFYVFSDRQNWLFGLSWNIKDLKRMCTTWSIEICIIVNGLSGTWM